MALRDTNAAVDFAGKEPEQAAQNIAALSVFFNPKSVAVVGASRERVNKAIASFIRLGWIEQIDRRYRITNREQLERRAR